MMLYYYAGVHRMLSVHYQVLPPSVGYGSHAKNDLRRYKPERVGCYSVGHIEDLSTEF